MIGATRHYGGPTDMLRQLGELDAAAVLLRVEGSFHLGYRVAASRIADARAVLEAFTPDPTDDEWPAWCIIAASALAGVDPMEVSPGSSIEMSLKAAYAAASAELMPAGMLDPGLLQ